MHIILQTVYSFLFFVKEYDWSVLKVCCFTAILENLEKINMLLFRISSGYFQVLNIIMNAQSVQNGEKNNQTTKTVDTQTLKHNKVAQNQTLSYTYLQRKEKREYTLPLLYCKQHIPTSWWSDDSERKRVFSFPALACVNQHTLLLTDHTLCYNFTLGPLEDINQICNCFSLRDCSPTTLLHVVSYWIDCKKSKKLRILACSYQAKTWRNFSAFFAGFFLFNTGVKLHLMVCKIFLYIHVPNIKYSLM